MACSGLKSTFHSRIGLVLLCTLHLLLNILALGLYAPLRGIPKYYGVVWFLFGTGSLVTFLVGIVFSICVAIRRGNWLIRWMGLFLLWAWPLFLVAFILTWMNAPGSSIPGRYVLSLVFQGLFVLFDLFFLLGLLIQRLSIAAYICNGSDYITSTGEDPRSQYQQIKPSETPSSICGPDVDCFCCTLKAGCQVFYLICLFALSYLAVGWSAYAVVLASVE